MKTVTQEIGETKDNPPKWVHLGLSRRGVEDEEADGDKHTPRITLFVEIDGVRVSQVVRKEGGSILEAAKQAVKAAAAKHEMFLVSDESIAFIAGYATYKSKSKSEM